MERYEKGRIDRLIDEVMDEREMELSDIPELDLYMDQVITLFERNLPMLARRDETKKLTKMMINNYSKEGLIKPVKGKKYTREQIVQMLLVYNLKQTLSLQKIKKLMTDPQNTPADLLPVYEQYVQEEKGHCVQFKQYLLELVEKERLQSESREQLFITVLLLAGMSAQLKELAESMIDEFYVCQTDSSKPKGKEKEKGKADGE